MFEALDVIMTSAHVFLPTCIYSNLYTFFLVNQKLCMINNCVLNTKVLKI